MAMRGLYRSGVVFCAMVLGGTLVWAQPKLAREVVSSGGVMGSLSGGKALTGTIGQVLVGTVRHPQPGTVPLGVPVTIYQGFWVPIDQTFVSVDDDPGVIAGEGMYAYPNPASSSTTLVLPAQTRGTVTVEIRSLVGAVVRVLAVQTDGDGTVEVPWDGLDASGAPVASGGYYCTATIPGSVYGQTIVRNVSVQIIR